MFTGIIQELGTVTRISRSNGLIRLTVQAPQTASRIHPMDSIAVNGVCLSAVDVRRPAIAFEVIKETRHVTTLGRLRRGDPVNLEPSLSLTDRLGGQFLFGHVDGFGTVLARRQMAGELVLEIRVASSLRKFLVAKGPIALDGVSLTVGRKPTASSCSVHVIPETLRRTTLGTLTVGDRVNIELDYIAKLVWQFVRAR